MCIICDAKKLSADPRKTAAEINRELLVIVQQAAGAIDKLYEVVHTAYGESRGIKPTEFAECDALASAMLDNRGSKAQDEPPTPEEIGKLLADLLGVEVEITRVSFKPGDETPPDGTTKH